MTRIALVPVLLLLATSVQAITPQVTIVPRHAEWRYDDTGTDLGTAWRHPFYNDGAWASGPGTLGYGELIVRTETSYGPSATNKYPTTYFRLKFQLDDDPADIRRLSLGVNYDDGFVMYLNDQELLRRNMPAGPISYGTFASSTVEGLGHHIIDVSSSIGLLVPGTNTLAVEVHQRGPDSSDLVWDMELDYTTENALITRGPYLQSATPTSVTVRWRTDFPGIGFVQYGTEQGPLTETQLGTLSFSGHEVTLTGLEPDTEYTYAVGLTGVVLAGDDAEHTFRTAPPLGTADETIRVWVAGDTGEATPGQEAVRDAYLSWRGSDRTDVWLLLGDNAYDTGTDVEYQAGLFEAYANVLRNHPLWPTRGNHDLLNGSPHYYDIFTLPSAGEAGGLASGTEAYYSFDHGNVHFICLDSQGSARTPGSAMLTWLQQDLAATNQDWIIAFWHHPPYTKGTHDSDDITDSGGRLFQMRQFVLPILEDRGVDLVLCGHSHTYERSFLLDGHYGVSSTLHESMKIDAGDGSETGTGAYTKRSSGPAPHEGAVYAVPGSGSKTGSGSLDHPVMVTSLEVLGSMAIDILGDRLDAVMIDDAGAVRDVFTIRKGVVIDVADQGAPVNGPLLAVGGNPSAADVALRVTTSTAGRLEMRVVDPTGRLVRRLVDERVEAGEHRFAWDGRDASGAHVAHGVYFVVMESVDGVRARKVVLVP